MTYRDDHDAALQRAAALEAELAHAKAERDQAVKDRDRLAGELAAEHARPPEKHVVLVTKTPLSSSERDELVGMLASGVAGYRARSWGGVAVGGVFAAIAFAGIAAASPQMVVGGLVVALLAGGLSLAQLARSTPERAQPVLDAVRDKPDAVSVVKRVSGKYGWWLIVETRQGELHMRGREDVIRLLERHCPGARFDG